MKSALNNIFNGAIFGIILMLILPDDAITIIHILITLVLNIKLISISTDKMIRSKDKNI